MRLPKRLIPVALAALLLVPAGVAVFVGNAAANNAGDVWLTDSPDPGAGHAHEPHLGCITTIYMHGSDLKASGTYVIDSIPPNGSGTQVLSGTWATPNTGDVIATFDGNTVVNAAKNAGATGNLNQGFHFKLTLSQEGVKHKTFWVDCGETPPAPSFSVSKTADAASVATGSDIGFTVTVTVGTNFANAVTLNDPLPAGTGVNWFIDPAYSGPGTCTINGVAPAQVLACSFGDLGNGGDLVASATVHIASHTTAATAVGAPVTFHNVATASADTLDPKTASADTAVDPAPVAPATPSLAITKTADAVTATAGSNVGFSIHVTNNGSGTALAAVLNDPMPSASGVSWSISPAYSGPGTCSITASSPQTLACALGDLASGASATVHVTSATPAGSAVTLDNTATAHADNNPAVTATASIDTTVPTQPQPKSPNLAITKTADAVTATAGSNVGFSIHVTNNGPGTALAALLNDPMPSASGVSWSISPAYSGPGTCSITASSPQTLACALGDLASGASATVHVASATPAGSAVTLDNTATAHADNNPAVTATASIATTVPTQPQAKSPSLAVTKTADSVTVTAGSSIGFTIQVTNNGTAGAANATLNDPLPSVTGTAWSISPAYGGQGSCSVNGSNPSQILVCSLGTLAAGASVSVHVTSPTSPSAAGTVTNVATALADNNPPVTGTAHVDIQTVSVLGETILGNTVVAPQSTTTNPSHPGTAVLGEQVATAPTGSLPRTGGVPIVLVFPAVGLMLVGAAVLFLARRKVAPEGR